MHDATLTALQETTFTGRDGAPRTLPPEDVDALRGSLDGPSLGPGDPDYDPARRIWNAMIDRRPALIARCAGAPDVARCVRFARRHGVALTVRGGGHNIGGRALGDGALLVDQSARREVRVNLAAGVAEVGPGATLGDLDAATAPHGRVVPTGIVSETGVAGLTLGGGFGWLSRRWGLTCDHLVAAEVVTADGPEELTSLLRLGAAPPAPFLPPALHGKPVAVSIACHSGDAAAAEQDLAPLREGAPVADLFAPRAFRDFQSLFDAGEPKGRRNYWKSEYVTDLDDELAAILLDASGRLPSPAANIKVFQLGGAVARLPAGATAAAHRDARFILVVATAWERPEDDAANVGWVRETWQRVFARSGRGGYVNFLTADAGADERAAAQSGVDFDRLDRVRRRFDPDGLFRTA